MKISFDWLKDFVDIPNESPKKLGERFTMSTAEVEEVLTTNTHLENTTVAEVESIEKHPEADKLNLVTFKTGSDSKRVVCGAPNVKIGMKVPYAPIGTKFPNGLELTPKKIRGVLSEGMLCSEEELGFSESASGLMELGSDATVGQTMLEYCKEVKDIILDIDNKSLTHRPDLWGHFGISREVSTIFGNPLKHDFGKEWEDKLTFQIGKGRGPVIPKLDGKSSCLAYYGLNIDGIKVKESPTWMKRRLTAVGLRPINNIVDISNYVMLELGIPLHIFDRDLIDGDEVVIRENREESTFTTLDEIERSLIPSDAVICDKKGPLVLGGIMGGLSCGVNENTSRVFIEVANWEAHQVRKTSTRLGLRTDSSQRHEKSLDSHLCKRTMLRTMELIMELSTEASVVGDLGYDGDDLSNYRPLMIDTSVKKINNVLGHTVSGERIIEIFRNLGFMVEAHGDSLKVVVPSFRATKDIEYEADLIEEIGRIVGYDNITPTSPPLDVSPTSLTNQAKIHRRVRSFLEMHSNAYEIMTYPMVGEKLLNKCFPGISRERDLVILNSLSKDQDRMRPSMIPGLLEAASLNQKNFDQFRFFELGRSYLPGDKCYSKDQSELGVVFFNKTNSCYMDLVNDTNRLLSHLNVPCEISSANSKFKNTLIPEGWSGVHPYETLDIRVMGKTAGSVFTIHPLTLKNFKIKGNLSLLILNLSSFEDREMKDKVKYTPLPKFPDSTFDWTVLAKRGVPVGDIMKPLNRVKIKEMVSCNFVDTFKLNEASDAVTLRAIFRDPEKTLSGEFLTAARDQLVKALDKAGFPLKMN